MGEKTDYIQLVERARLGDEESMNRLAEAARERLRVYVYRLVLREDAVQDILQETILEMFKILSKLRRADRFWSWLYGIATNKVHRYHRTEQYQRKVCMSAADNENGRTNKQEGLENLVSSELKQIVSGAMKKLSTRHRAVLIMRCYDDMAYSEIAESLGCSEFGTRMLFCRAKRALQKQLCRHGFGRGSLLAALIVFGKMTAPSEAAAADVSVTTATMNAGVAASVTGFWASKATVVSLTTVAVIGVGTAVTTSVIDRDGWTKAGAGGSKSSHVMALSGPQSGSGEQCWYYYPSNGEGAVMMRLVKGAGNGGRSYCRHLQNEDGNYYFDKAGNTIHIENCRMWEGDLSVRRLPSDSAQLSEFLSKIDGRVGNVGYVGGGTDGLLVVVKQGGKGQEPSQVTYHHNVLDEEYFRYDWPVGAGVVDNRDKMHRRGWTYFRISGEINGQAVSGTGRLPFVYSASEKRPAWVRLQIGPVVIVDNGRGAHVSGSSDLSGRYEGGSFFEGLARPWMGLHTIDTIRRDAALHGIPFESRYIDDGRKAQIVLQAEQGRMVYTVDMGRDIIESIEFSRGDGSGGKLGFSYMEEVNHADASFAEPRTGGHGRLRRSAGVTWLLELARSRH